MGESTDIIPSRRPPPRPAGAAADAIVAHMQNAPRWRRGLESITTRRPVVRLLSHTLHRFDVPLFRLMSGRSPWGWGYPFLLLTTTGARSGRPRAAPLLYVELEDGVIAVVGSNFGGPRTPAWCHNLRADPACSVLLNGRSWPATAREPQAAERDAIWAAATATYSGYAHYRAWAPGRDLPLFVLTAAARTTPDAGAPGRSAPT